MLSFYFMLWMALGRSYGHMVFSFPGLIKSSNSFGIRMNEFGRIRYFKRERR